MSSGRGAAGVQYTGQLILGCARNKQFIVCSAHPWKYAERRFNINCWRSSKKRHLRCDPTLFLMLACHRLLEPNPPAGHSIISESGLSEINCSSIAFLVKCIFLGLDSRYTAKYGLSPRELPRADPWAQAIFRRLSLLSF